MKTLLRQKQAAVKERQQLSADALGIIANHLRALMSQSKTLFDRKTLSTRSGVSQRTIGALLAGKGNPTLANVEAIATAYGLDLWEMLNPELDVKRVALNASETEGLLHRQIEENMRRLKLTKYRLPGDAP